MACHQRSDRTEIDQQKSALHRRYDHGNLHYLRLLYARIGTVHCHSCNLPIAAQTVQQMVDRVLRLPQGTRFSVLAPIVRSRKGEFKKSSIRCDAKVCGGSASTASRSILSEDTIKIDKNKAHTIEVYVDRLVVKSDVRQRLTEAVELSLQLAGRHRQGIAGHARGRCAADGVGITDENGDIIFPERFACINCGVSYPGNHAAAVLASNNPSGVCPACDVTASAQDVFDLDPRIWRCVKARSSRGTTGRFSADHQALAQHYGFDMAVPWSDLPQNVRTTHRALRQQRRRGRVLVLKK